MRGGTQLEVDVATLPEYALGERATQDELQVKTQGAGHQVRNAGQESLCESGPGACRRCSGASGASRSAAVATPGVPPLGSAHGCSSSCLSAAQHSVRIHAADRSACPWLVTGFLDRKAGWASTARPNSWSKAAY